MPFQEVSNKVDFPAQEREILKFWKETQAFEKMVQLHKGQPHWSFIDGPITANNPMGVHHGWGRTYKDVMVRFQTMRGHELRYQNGFDCQGLWVEVNVERDLGFKSKKDIEAYGLAQFVLKCKERVLRYAAVQTDQSIRLGYWMDWNEPEHLLWLGEKLLENPLQEITVEGPEGAVTGTVEQIVGRLGLPEIGGSYFTFSDENNYVIWSFIKKCWQNGWLYRGADVMPWCPRCATGISQHEIATDGYRELTHRSVTLKFPLRGRPGESLLVWTTTPWTLSSNVAAAVGPDLTYCQVKQGEQIYYLSKGTLKLLKGGFEILAELKGRDLEGWTYDGPFDDLPAAHQLGGATELTALIEHIATTAAAAHRVILWDAVGEAEGTGIVHIAPGCGAEDFQLGKQYNLPMLAPLDEEGYFVGPYGWLTGQHVSEIADQVFAELERKGIMYRVENYTHRYPVCWRCSTELVFRLVDEWYISMGPVYDKPRETLTAEEKANSLRYQIMDVVDKITWIPDFGHAREMDWLRNMHDWMISKKRYWGLALPIWTCDSCTHFEVIGDEHELKARAAQGWAEFEGHTPHRPYIDSVKVTCPKCSSSMSRIPDVGNPWLDAGVVSFSTLQFRKNLEYWREWFPANWISESFPGQFRNWFYSLLVMGTVLAGQPPFLQNFGYGTLLAEDGRPMHKSSGNSIEFNEAADKMGVDVMRWLYSAHKPEADLLFGFHAGDEVRRRFLIPLWNIYSFFVTYARLDGWTPSFDAFNPAVPEGPTPASEHLLDRWVLARLNEVVSEVGINLEKSDYFAAAWAVEPFIDDLSNWYLRRSRRRFWKSEHDGDKNSAYTVLYHVLVKLIKTLAPTVPFVSEVMYQNLVRSVAPADLQPAPYESVHMTDWPLVDWAADDQDLLEQMALARRIASLGLSARGNANLKVRQPLNKVLVHTGRKVDLVDELSEIVLDELNVKHIEFVEQEGALVTYKIMPDNKLLGPKMGARFPALRAALSAAEPALVVAAVREGTPFTLDVAGEPLELLPAEIIIQTQPAAGLVVAADKAITVGLETAITPELRLEGLAREAVRRIQDMRKKANFNIEDRIVTTYQVEGELAQVFQVWGDYIKAETLTTSLSAGPGSEAAFKEEHSIEGMPATLTVQQAR